MSEKHVGASGSPDNGLPIEDLIRAALRSEGLLVPQTVEEVRRFEDELARNPVEVPAHLLTTEWLFNASRETDELPVPTMTCADPPDNCAVAARDGSAIPNTVAGKMRKDRGRHEDSLVLQATDSGDSDDEVIQFGSSQRLREIADFAEWVAKENCPKGVVVPADIASRNAIGVSFNDYEDAFDGLLEHQSGRFHIYCNLKRVGGQNSDRARFTLSHELAHFFIDAHRQMLERGQSLPLSQCDYESAAPIEREADCFAAHLLMPSERFQKQARGMKPGLPTILSLRKHFSTSVSSTACRYATLGIAPCVVLKWSKDGFGWQFMSAAARDAGLGKMIASRADLPANSPTAKALAGNSPSAKGFFESGTTAAMWFRSVTEGSFRNIILIEQAIPLGRFGAITILFPESGNFPRAA